MHVASYIVVPVLPVILRSDKGLIYAPSKFDQNPNFFTINGKAFPDTIPLYTRFGQKIRLRFINKSSDSHSMHLHGHDFAVVTEDGFPRPGFMKDTISVESVSNANQLFVEIIVNISKFLGLYH